MGTYFLGSESKVIRLSGQKGRARVELISDLFTLNMYEWFFGGMKRGYSSEWNNCRKFPLIKFKT